MFRRSLVLATLAAAVLGPIAPEVGVESATASAPSGATSTLSFVVLASAERAIAEEPEQLLETVVATNSQPEPEPVLAPSAPTAAPVAATVAPVAAPVAAPRPVTQPVCPASHFCYPRVGIAGPIVPYSDCTGSTDVGTAIRSLTCVSPTYLAAHAYTQFGRIAGWRAGDVVFAYGARYVLVDAFTQPACVSPARALAPLSLQTSLTAVQCGPVLVIQGRPE